MEVPTAAGTLDTARLGRTLMHEHVFIMSPEVQQNYPDDWGDEDRRVDDAVARLDELKANGMDTILDVTVIGLGRYIPRIQRIAERTDLAILVATGIYIYNELDMYYAFRGPGTVLGGDELITDMFVRDITKGIADTGVRAAVLKCATDEQGVTRDVERVLRAIAQAHRETGVPITTHTHAHTHRGLEQQRIFAEEGVDLSRVIIGHSGDTTDVAYLEELIAVGSYIGMDRFGIEPILPFEDRVATVATMCERGHADRMVLSHDAACHNAWMGDEIVATATPSWHYLHISHDVIPALRARGVTDEQFDQMLVHNPRAIFERQGGY